MSSIIQVVDYDPNWARQFQDLKSRIWPLVKHLALSFEHVGSTAIPDLAAKPIIDVDIIIEDIRNMREVVHVMTALGYEHRGNLGIEGREAFREPDGSIPHHLYVCFRDCLALRNHLKLREILLSDSLARKRYSEIKKELATKYPNDIDAYVEGKTALILELLETAGLTIDEQESIRRVNKNPNKP